MGNKKQNKLIVLILLLLVTCYLVYRPTTVEEVNKPLQLQNILGPVDGYRVVAFTPLDTDIISFLDLDDYTQTRYEKEGQFVDLFIGYYYTLDKISAAHSPLVCYPGQGWTITQPVVNKLRIGSSVINYKEIGASLEGRKDIVLYWFQAHDKTTTKPFMNKFNTLVNQIVGKKQEHAFVRVSVPLGKSSMKNARTVAEEFMFDFYPAFLAFINNTTQVF